MISPVHILAGVPFTQTHKRKQCAPGPCIFHNPTNHKMRNWKPNLRASGLIERICPHGCGHPDPDSAAGMARKLGQPVDTWLIHGCDGCCIP